MSTARRKPLLLLLGLSSAIAITASVADAGSPAPSHTVLLGPRTKTSACHVRGPLPDRRCSPGAIYADATLQIICKPHYTDQQRDVSEGTKARVFLEYDLPIRHHGRTYEVDHIVPLEVGGSNSIANLYPEAAAAAPGYHVKDKLENRLQTIVCSRKMRLRQAQHAIASNWVALYRTVYGRNP